MKNANVKRALAFWLAVAMLASSAPMALAAPADKSTVSTTTNTQTEPTDGSTGETDGPNAGQTGSTVTTPTISTVKIDGQASKEVTVTGSGQAVTCKLTAEGTALEGATITYSSTNTLDGVSLNDDTITIQPNAKAGTYTISAAVQAGGAVTADAAPTATLTVKRDETAQKTVTALEISALSEATIPGEVDLSKVTVTAKNIFGDTVSDAQVTWSLKTPSAGVTLDGTTLKIDKTAENGSVTVTATSGNATKDATISLKREVSKATTIELYVKDSVDPINGGTLNLVQGETASVRAAVLDQYGDPMTGQTVTYKVTAPTSGSGVSVADDTITVTDTATVGNHKIEASVNGVTASFTVEVAEKAPVSGQGAVAIEITNLSNITYGTATIAPVVTVTKNGQPVTGVTPEIRYYETAKAAANGDFGSTKAPTEVGHYVARVTCVVDGKTAVKEQAFSIVKATLAQPGNQSIRALAGGTATGAIPTDMLKDGRTYKVGKVTDANKILNTYKMDGDKLSVTLNTNAAVGATATIPVTISYRNYNDVTVNFIVTVTSNAPKSSITLTTAQMSSRRDDNYNNFNRYERNESDGYLRLYLDGTDDLYRQTVDGTTSEWVGLDIWPHVNGTGTTNLYVAASKSGTWYALQDDLRLGDFYIEDVSSTSFELWFDTDDCDCADSLYLATDSRGSNAFELYVDFDSYYYRDDDDDDDDDRDSTSTSTVGGDKVVTTTIDRSPSIRGSKASISISSSAIDSAIRENNRIYKDRKGDEKVISVDANTSRSCDETVVTIPKRSVDKIADEDASLKLVTKQGTVTIDNRALARVVDQASGSDVEFCVEKNLVDEFVLYAKSGRSYLTDLGTGGATITLPYSLRSGQRADDLRVYRVGDAQNVWASLDVQAAAYGVVTEMQDVSYKSGKVTFAADDLGTFRITDERMTTGGVPSGTFYDVPNTRWSAPYIYKLASLGIISGTGNGMFEPNLYVTREEFVKILAGVAGADVSHYAQSKFTDVPANRWSAPYIAWAASLGITQGDTPYQFAPTKYISRQEMATMIYRYVQIAGKTLPARNPAKTFADSAQIASWAVTPVTVMQQAGIIDGNVTGGRYTFDPMLSASREECAKMLAVLYDLI